MSTQKISQDEFAHIAKLSRLTISDEEAYIADQLSQAADYVQVLNELDTASVTPTYQVNHKSTVLREDIVIPSFSQATALSQAPKSKNGYFVTKATIKKK
ncbi:MAG TPA: Asp-tRNA(Asn)/Glu-tRNA(Gln) amidotransferase subunit GatC [Patescibacteria group bacterium]